MTKEKFIYYKNSVLIIYLGAMIFTYLVLSLRKTLFVRMSEGLTCTVRKELFKAIFHKQVSWFDNETHAPGVISSLMTENITQLNGMTSEFLAVIFESVLIVLFATCVGFLISWQQAIICIILSPIIIGGTIIQIKIQFPDNKATSNDEDEDRAKAIIGDIIINYKTVISFGQKNIDKIIEKFDDLRRVTLEKNLKLFILAGAANGWGCGGRVTYAAAIFIIGRIYTVDRLEVEWYKVVAANFIIFMAMMSAGF